MALHGRAFKHFHFHLACAQADHGTLAIWHLIFSLMALGYGFEYYFHLSECLEAFTLCPILTVLQGTTRTTLIRRGKVAWRPACFEHCTYMIIEL